MTTPATLPRLFVASDRRELEPWVARWENLREIGLHLNFACAGKWRGRDMIAIANGVGMQRAVAGIHTVQNFANKFSALDPKLAISDIVVATNVINEDRNWPALDPHGPPARFGTVYTARQIIRTSEEKKNLHQTGAILVEMEAGGVASMAKELAVPFYCVRVVSDLAEESFFIDFEEFLLPDGQFNVAGLMRFAVTHPFRGLPELLRLQERMSKGARLLGDFLGECAF